jgi:SAM-dependent methyltransferase
MRIEDRVRAVMSGVDRTIAPGDTMYTTDDHYFSVAASALHALLAALESAGLSTPRRVFDFGCGYGRVMRALRAAFPEAELLASDLDAGGVSHCATAFGARPVQTSADIDRMEQVRDVDLIWCGSVMTHLDAAQGELLLGYFANALAPGGVAVMTTHGRKAARRLEQVTDYGLAPRARASVLASYRSRGFGYHDYPGQRGYGISVGTPARTVGHVFNTPSLRIIGYVEAGWDGHQDVLSVAKDADRVLERV